MFDIKETYSADCDVSVVALCHELMNEYENSTGLVPPGEETYRDKFKNHDESGLLDKLKKNINFDMESIAGESKSELFDMLKILKQLYYIEKSGEPKYKQGYADDIRIQITDILAKPRLANIQTEFSDTSVYGDVFESLFNTIKSVVDDSDERCLRLEKINAYWEYITEKIFDYVITDRALAEPNNAIKKLDRINRFLQEKVLDKLQGFDATQKSQPEGVMKTFFNILACHRLLCNEVDRIHINYQICLSDAPCQEYVDYFKKYEGCEAKWEILPFITQRLMGKNENTDAGIALYFISYGLDIDDSDITHYKYAVKNARTVASWIEKYKQADFSQGIPLDMLSIIMQEIINNKKNGDKVENDYFGYNNKCKSLMTAIKNPGTADAIVMQAWIKKLENRTVVNFGAYDLIKKKREIETTIYEIKKVIYSYRNLDDLEFVNDVLSHFVARSVTSRDLAMDVGVHFADKVAAGLKGSAKQLTDFQMWPEGINVLDMFREFLVDKYNIEDAVAADIARQVNEFYEEKSTVTGRGMCCNLEVYFSEKYHHDFLFMFFVDRERHRFEYQQFLEVCSDEDADRMIQLGLAKFVKR